MGVTPKNNEYTLQSVLLNVIHNALLSMSKFTCHIRGYQGAEYEPYDLLMHCSNNVSEKPDVSISRAEETLLP
jgi:hypothetical protein